MSFIYGAGLENKKAGSSDMQPIDTHSKKTQKTSKFQALRNFTEICEPDLPIVDDIYDIWSLEDLFYESECYDYSNDFDAEISLSDKFGLLSWLCAQVSMSAAGSIMLQEAMNEGWTVSLEDLNGPDFHIDVPDHLIVLDSAGMLLSALGRSEYFRNILLVSFTRALRDVWQEKRHGGFDEIYAPADILMLERVRAADLDVMAVMVAWEIRGEGHGSLWRHLVGSEDGDIAMRFAGYVDRDPSSLDNGQALAASFVQWFRNPERLDLCEHEILNDLDMIMTERQGLKQIFGHEKLTPIKIESLSCLPDRTAYLHHKGREIMGDPLFTGMTSMVNQAHLMQILHDMSVTRVQGVPFRNADLASRIFPSGEFTADIEKLRDL
ncbi:MAG: hypothetical protein KTR28_05050 [Micavibrio sp.]|nr:hypothetical protein [Micavibrio sp.]